MRVRRKGQCRRCFRAGLDLRESVRLCPDCVRVGTCKTCDVRGLVLVDGFRCAPCRVVCFGPEALDSRGRAVRPAHWL